MVPSVPGEAVREATSLPDKDGFADVPGVDTEANRVLLVPLASGTPRDVGSFHLAAETLATWYWTTGASILLLEDVRQWRDFDRQVEALHDQGERFDRVVIISHGGWDGPVADPEDVSSTMGLVLSSTDTLTDEVYFRARYQPETDLLRTFRYDRHRHPELHAYLMEHGPPALFRDFARLPIVRDLVDESDVAECMQARTTTCEDDCVYDPHRTFPPSLEEWTSCTEECLADEGSEEICLVSALRLRGWTPSVQEPWSPPASFDTDELPNPASLERFGATLASITEQNAIIFLGHCNAATPQRDSWPLELADVSEANPEDLEPLESPYEGDSFAHRLARVSDRFVAAPIGKTSWHQGDEGDLDALDAEQTVLATCYGSSVRGVDVLGPRAGRPALCVVDGARGPRGDKPGVAMVRGFNVHAQVAIDGRDRKRLERIVADGHGFAQTVRSARNTCPPSRAHGLSPCACSGGTEPGSRPRRPP